MSALFISQECKQPYLIMALEYLIMLKERRLKRKKEKQFYMGNLSGGSWPWNLEVIMHCWGNKKNQNIEQKRQT